MAGFELSGELERGKQELSLDDVKETLKEILCQHYRESNIQITPDGVSVKGRFRFRSFFEGIMTSASVVFEIEDDKLCYRVRGSSSLGTWPWVWFAIGFFTYGLGFLFWLYELIQFLVCQDRPKRYFEEALQALERKIA